MSQGKLKKKMDAFRLHVRQEFSSDFLRNSSDTKVEDVKVEVEVKPGPEELYLRDDRTLDIKEEHREWPKDDLKSLIPVQDDASHTLQHGVCRCCLSQGTFQLMDESSKLEDHPESYTEMLTSAFGLTLARGPARPLICRPCAARLTQALDFREQVVAVEQAFLLRQPTYVTEADNGKVIWKMEPQESDIEVWDLDDDVPLSTIPPAKHKPSTAASTSAQLTYPAPFSFDKSHIKQEKIECSVCEAKIAKYSLHKHLRVKHLWCSHCSESFKTREAMSEHVLNTHPTKCIFCGMGFGTDSKRKLHIASVHGKKCSMCNERFSEKELKKHKKEVHGDQGKTVQCGVCDLVCDNNTRLVRHQRRVHLGQREVPCPHCDYMTFDNMSLKKHILVHGVIDKTYECKHCGKKFLRKSNLTYHERIHTGDKRSVCKLCGEAFVQRASLKYHLERHHPGQNC